ncbi:MAG: hypothetical protein AAFX78_01175 [Cyanobacteria bacterium J06638_20]
MIIIIKPQTSKRIINAYPYGNGNSGLAIERGTTNTEVSRRKFNRRIFCESPVSLSASGIV